MIVLLIFGGTVLFLFGLGFILYYGLCEEGWATGAWTFSGVLLLFTILIGLCYMSAYKSTKYINRVYNMDIKVDEYLWNEEIIKDSIIGKRQNIYLEDQNEF